MKRRFLNSVLIILFLLASPSILAEDELEPGNWEKVNRLNPGDRITVYLKDDNKQECLYRKIAPKWIGSASFEDGSSEDHFAETKALWCWSPVNKPGSLLIQIDLESVDKITLFDDVSDSMKTIYVSKEAALAE